MILEFIQSLLQANPTAAVVLSCVGAFRVILVPLMSLAKYISSKTPSKLDDHFLEKLESSKFYTMIRFGLDWLASIKLPESKK